MRKTEQETHQPKDCSYEQTERTRLQVELEKAQLVNQALRSILKSHYSDWRIEEEIKAALESKGSGAPLSDSVRTNNESQNRSDANCYTLHDGSCIGESCMHSLTGGDNAHAAVAAIAFALSTDEGLIFLRLWNEGDFDSIRDEWPDCPQECFVGADPLYKNETSLSMAAEAAPEELHPKLRKLRTLCQRLATETDDAGARAAYNTIRSYLDITAPAAQEKIKQPSFQKRVEPWMQACFGHEISFDPIERNHRFLEEALELVQSCGCTEQEALSLISYVYSRPVGETPQEVGGVMVTLAALCMAHKIDMHQCGETELARIWTKVEQIRAKQATKPKHLPATQSGKSNDS